MRRGRVYIFFFFQAEDGIRDKLVTGVQTCALPIWRAAAGRGWSRGSVRADGSRETVRALAGRRVVDPRELPARAARGGAARVPGEPVPLVAGARIGARREAAPAAVRRLPGDRAAPGGAEQRRR